MKKKSKLLTLIVSILMLSLVIPATVPIVGTVENVSAAVKISQKSLILLKGQSKTLKITGTKNKPKWSSSNRSVSTISQNGKVVAQKKGSSTITAKIGKKSYKCKIVVQDPVLSSKTITLTAGSSKTLKLSGTNQKVIWNNSNRQVAIYSNGKVRALNVGKCKITATVLGRKYVCNIIVKPKNIPTSSLSITASHDTIVVGNTLKLNCRIYPFNATNRTIKWVSSNNLVASISSNGTVTAKSKGSSTITATSGGKSAAYILNVDDPQINKTSLILELDDAFKLNISGTTRRIEWYTMNNYIASVENGIVTANNEGTCTIYAKISDYPNDFVLTCNVTVTQSTKPGSEKNPLPSHTPITSDIYTYDQLLGKFSIQLLEYQEGEAAWNIVKTYKYNREPNGQYEKYLYFKFKLTYIDGTKTVRGGDIFSANHLRNPNTGAGYNILYYAIMPNREEDFNVYMYPGNTYICSAAYMVQKDAPAPMYRIQTGFNFSQHYSNVTWFKTY